MVAEIAKSKRIISYLDSSFVILILLLQSVVCGQDFDSRVTTGDPIPRDVREMIDAGLEYLAKNQNDNGTYSTGDAGPGTTALALLAILAMGDDPNFGKYSSSVNKSLRFIIKTQSPHTGIIGPSMYHHGFSMLALAEAYGTVDDSNLWSDGTANEQQRSIGQALELSVRGAITSQQKNPFHAWRYSPNGTDADTSVSGAILMGLLAARNAGIEVPDSSIDQAINYFTSLTSSGGVVGYTGGFEGFGESQARSAVALLVYRIAKRTDLPQYEHAKKYVLSSIDTEPNSFPEYTRYYQAQAIFQADKVAWKKWNEDLIVKLKSNQQSDGSFRGQMGKSNDTSMSLLALALNYRFLPIYER